MNRILIRVHAAAILAACSVAIAALFVLARETAREHVKADRGEPVFDPHDDR